MISNEYQKIRMQNKVIDTFDNFNQFHIIHQDIYKYCQQHNNYMWKCKTYIYFHYLCNLNKDVHMLSNYQENS
ncbi:unnamed protein product [Paramecium octaurelia]|uniref:Uncharacterized protein n=1 Tax=Paramecium octaurelia TaxID=43137 RepID=A0A8S1WVD8_PAROT|nr:unnamed protein product [Paramecium octaurelia]